MKRRIALISEHASPLADLGSVDSGGQNVYVAQVAGQLARLGYEVDVFTRRDHKNLPDVLSWKDGIRIIHVTAGPAEFICKEELLPHMKSFTDHMIAFCKLQTRPYDLMHANFWMSGLVAADVKLALGIPFVITFHALGKVRRQYQGDRDGFPNERFQVEERIVREADGIIAECPQDQVDLVQLYSADPGRIVQIPCGFDSSEFEPVDAREARRHIGVSEDDWVVLQLGRMVPRKGIATALRGFARLAKEPDVSARMVIVGGESRDPDPVLTPEIGSLQKIAEEEGVLEQTLFTGRRGREELKYYFSAADVFISTPWYEPFGLTPVESMACGTPVIGSNVGGIKYTVLDEETGYLVPPEDPQAIGDHLIELYQNPGKLKQLGDRALERVNELFTWEKVSGMISDFYLEILNARKTWVVNDTEDANRSTYRSEERAIVWHAFESALETFQRSQHELNTAIMNAGDLLLDCMSQGGKVMVCGNGGSAADAQHFAAELLGRFVLPDRRGLPVVSLNADTAFLTAWSNDMGYENVFARQVEALGQPGDLLIGISTSGDSENLVRAFTLATEMKMKTMALLGGDGGNLLPLADAAILVPSRNTQRIQEVQILVLHLLCELLENYMSTNQLMPASILMENLSSEKVSIETKDK